MISLLRMYRVDAYCNSCCLQLQQIPRKWGTRKAMKSLRLSSQRINHTEGGTIVITSQSVERRNHEDYCIN
jgi:hypothetical protein